MWLIIITTGYKSLTSMVACCYNLASVDLVMVNFLVQQVSLFAMIECFVTEWNNSS